MKVGFFTGDFLKSFFDRDVLPFWNQRLLSEITPDDLRQLCAKVKDKGAPATAIHIRDIVKQIFASIHMTAWKC